MNNTINVNLRDLEQSIESAQIEDYEKKILYEMLQGILSSQRGRLYVKNFPDYEEYVALRDQPGDNEQDLSFCIVKRMVDEYSGSTSSRAYEFPCYKELLKYYSANRAAINLEMSRAKQNKGKSIATELTKEPTKPQSIIDDFRERISKLTNVPQHKRQRALDVLDALENSHNGKFFIIKQADYEEYIAVRDGEICIGRRMIDYTGGTAGRTHRPMVAIDFIEYLEANKDKLGEETKRGYYM